MKPQRYELDAGAEAEHFSAQEKLGRLDNYYAWILDQFGETVGRRVWDAGAGTGHMAALLRPRVDLLLATEFSDGNLRALEQRFADDAKIEVRRYDLQDEAANSPAHGLDTVIVLDVLEHLEDDLMALRKMHLALEDGGRLLVKVPAMPSLYCGIDEASHHYRRYTRRQLRDRLTEAGFGVVRARYMNLPGAIAYFWKGKIRGGETNFSATVHPGRMGFYNSLIPWIARWERLVPAPVGLSVIAIAERRAAA
jgi:SAM-dependent methyltransferase